jgi:hypothetical protein
MVEDFPADTSDPSFGDSILPGSLYARPFRLQARGLQERNHFSIELRIVIQNDVTIRLLSRECLPKLLDYPICSWVSGDVTVQNLATLMINHEEAIQQMEGESSVRWKNPAPRSLRDDCSETSTNFFSDRRVDGFGVDTERQFRSEMSNPSFSNSPHCARHPERYFPREPASFARWPGF